MNRYCAYCYEKDFELRKTTHGGGGWSGSTKVQQHYCNVCHKNRMITVDEQGNKQTRELYQSPR